MTKPFTPPRPRQSAPVAAEQIPTLTSTHRESDDAYRVVAAPFSALPERASDWAK